MNSQYWINTECIRLVCEAAQETGSCKGLEALRLALGKMDGKASLVNVKSDIVAALQFVDARLRKTPQPRRHREHQSLREIQWRPNWQWKLGET